MRKTNYRLVALERAMPQPPQWEELDDETMRLAFELLTDEDLGILLTAEFENRGDLPHQGEVLLGEVAVQAAFAKAVAEGRAEWGLGPPK